MICVIEDDQPVRDSIAILLESVGLKSICFDSAESLLREGIPDSVQCMVVDIRLPGMTGIDLLCRLAERGVELPSIVMTGHGDPETLGKLASLRHVRFIEKPFNPSDFLGFVREAATQASAIERADNA